MDSNQGSGSFYLRLNFQRIVIIIAIIMLIAAMVFIGYALYKQSNDVSWPPKIPKCPDYWTLNANGTCIKPNPPIASCEYNGIPAGTQGMPTCPP
jgi:hypothetical protein